jgi:hypothetical protein
MTITLDWYLVVQLALFLLACYACFTRGRQVGIEQAVENLVAEGLVDEKQLNALIEKRMSDED